MNRYDELRAMVTKYLRDDDADIEDLREAINLAQELHVNLVGLVQDICSPQPYVDPDLEDAEDEEVQWEIAQRQIDRDHGK